MDKIRVSKVEKIECTKAGTTYQGTIHLTAHHLIFQFDDAAQKEMWVPYPLISLVTRLPQTLYGRCPLTFHSRTFETFSLSFIAESDALAVFDSVKELTVAPSVNQLYAFFYNPNPPFPTETGWSIYSPKEEFSRMGVGSRSKAWRFTDINKDYSFSPTYPARLVVPTKISDTTLQYASKYRSKARIPVLTYLHWSGYGSITRSSQPMVGITQNRSIQDEKLIEAIFQTHFNPESRVSSNPVYGATSTNLIIDARPTTNALANTAKGAGTENMDHYKDGRKVYLGIDNIHTMRESLAKIVESLREADSLLSSINNDLAGQISNISVLDRQTLRRSGWLRHLAAIIEGSVIIARNVHVNSSHVLIHCSDGWDRTAQLSSISQLCLDPFYRTIKGFEILIEKDWMAFGHRFMDRCGHLSSDKFFVGLPENSNGGGGTEGAQAFLASVQNRFTTQNHIKETSPVFHQFLECVRNIQRQFPSRFEFNERFLHQLYYHLYSCQFGTFLFNSERERRVSDDGLLPPCERTHCVWDFLNTPVEMELNLNPSFDPSLDDPKVRTGDMGVLLPNAKDVRFWHELYGRTDEEMNGRLTAVVQVREPEIIGPIQDEEDDPIIQRARTPSKIPLPPSPSKPPASPIPSRSRTSNASISPLFDEEQNEETSHTRDDSFKPFSSSSAFSLKPTGNSYSSAQSLTSARSTFKTPDFFSNNNVKSVWGRLSSNASAALSVVQEAYEGVSKSTSEKAEELRGKESLNAWGESSGSPRTIPSPFQSSPTISSNPWATTPPKSVDPLIENPWGTVRATSSKSRDEERILDSASLFSSPSLPLDPTITDPASLLPRRANSASSISSSYVRPQSQQPPRSDNNSNDNTDPLGVGIW